ncbi:hypothetical protein GCM10007276_31620 [Agaricicola taiwanensis]|uniref:DUF423 domain-containing protein n=1 Tax=Agaricicola taiwanensis TaxID=591372 RepID=A0A8J3DZY0_9RHOB|nr:DUF423 domain-containing protein [Agaricicola taiwanensis]GGE52291.1 hypothetical protein GCM10007276_31620 [Agaricicola taiwanensis]
MLVWFPPLMIVLAGLLGAAGVAAAAASSHATDGPRFASLALIALTQAPALLALGLYAGPGTVLRIGGLVIALGALLFCLDLASRQFIGNGLFPMSAPLGGMAMIAGWLLVGIGGLILRF